VDEGVRTKIRNWPSAVVVGVTAWVLTACVLLYRLPYGASNKDEAFYSAMPYSFLLGNRPYTDELALHQNAGLLLVPFYRVYVAIVGSADGIILFNRSLYFIYTAVCSVMTYRFVRSVTAHGAACWAGALVLSFSYFNLFALSYNTQGAFGVLCGSLCTAHALRRSRPGRMLFGASLFFLSALFSYPGSAAAVVPYAVVVVWWLFRRVPPSARSSGLIGLGAGVAVALATLVPLALWIGAPGFQRLREFSQSMGYATNGIAAKLDFYHSTSWDWHWPFFGFVALFTLLPILCLLLQRQLGVVALATLVASGFCYFHGLRTNEPIGVTVYLTAIPVLAPVSVALNRGWQHGGLVLSLVWLPSVLSMAAIAYSSANGYDAVSLGALGALVAGVSSFWAYLSALSARRPARILGYRLVLGSFFVSCLALQLHSLFEYVYDEYEHSFQTVDTRIHNGPLRGTIATPGGAALAEAVDHDLKSLQASAKTLTVFDSFATGYLSTRLQPRTFTQWIVWVMNPKYDLKIMEETFGDGRELPDLVLKIHMWPVSKKLWAKYERGHYHVAIERKDLGYVIMSRNTP